MCGQFVLFIIITLKASTEVRWFILHCVLCLFKCKQNKNKTSVPTCFVGTASVVLFTFLTTHSYLFSFLIVLSLSWNSIGLHTLNTGLVLQTLTGCWDFMTAVVLVSAITTRTAGSKFYHFLCRLHQEERHRCQPQLSAVWSSLTDLPRLQRPPGSWHLPHTPPTSTITNQSQQVFIQNSSHENSRSNSSSHFNLPAACMGPSNKTNPLLLLLYGYRERCEEQSIVISIM